MTLGHGEAPLNVNEKQLVGSLLDQVLMESIEVELLAGDSQFKSSQIFGLLESNKISHVIPWRRMRRRVNPPYVHSVKDRIDVEVTEHLRCIHHRLRAPAEDLIGRVKSSLWVQWLTLQGLDNASIHVCLVLMMVYAAAIAEHRLGRAELGQSVAFLA